MKLFWRKERFREGGYAQKRRIFNYRFVATVIGVLCHIQVVALLSAVAVSLYYHDEGLLPLTLTACIMGLVGGLLLLLGRKSREIETGRRESLMSVTLSWFVVSLIGMLPYILSGAVPSVADAFFETISGYTTTGASVIPDVESVPRSLLFWRSITQWEGGIGIIVFLVALIPMTGESATMVYNSETTGVTHDRFLPRVGNMAKWMMIIYVTLTALCIVLLILGPMDLFDAVCHAFTCISTGGFSTRNISIGYWDSDVVNIILDLFMFIGATNFTLIFFAFTKRDPGQIFKDSEFRWFFGLIVVLSILGTVGLMLQGSKDTYTLWETVSAAVTQVISLATTTGYAVGDYNLWGSLFALVITFAMFVAGCTGSTSGGLKAVRFEILIKSLSNELLKRTHPNAIRTVRIGRYALSNDVVLSTMNFFVAYFALILFGTLCVSLDGVAFSDSLVAAVSCVSNSGGSLGEIGPLVGFSALSDANKVILSLLMVMGRLEIFTFLSILHPGFWRN